jgi:O-acetyl-ADP-ribose deacetylase (regulator of RNase III)
VREVVGRIEVVTGDITALAVDAIVNAANASLRGGGGVDGAIHRAAGPKLLEECLAIGGCPPGEARMTGGYELAARWVIHAVGPIWRGGDQGEPAVLASAYTESLRLARRSELATLAFPALSTGAYGFPLEPATRIALRTVGAWLVEHEWPRRVTFCCFTDGDAAVYRSLLERLAGAG